MDSQESTDPTAAHVQSFVSSDEAMMATQIGRATMNLDAAAEALKAYGGLEKDFVDGVASKLNKSIDASMSREQILALSAVADGHHMSGLSGVSIDLVHAAYEAGVGTQLNSGLTSDPTKSAADITNQIQEEQRKKDEEEKAAKDKSEHWTGHLTALAASGAVIKRIPTDVMNLSPELTQAALEAIDRKHAHDIAMAKENYLADRVHERRDARAEEMERSMQTGFTAPKGPNFK